MATEAMANLVIGRCQPTVTGRSGSETGAAGASWAVSGMRVLLSGGPSVAIAGERTVGAEPRANGFHPARLIRR
ncbi:hypothetical protein GCM10023235_46440 [Kitasatospora terrestris]|uniref:Uncharacterized protein n=1 Tax=Kitasatospora terrestris TaxID=258051 RepID=A0ABP9DYN4_9ACTN